MSIIHDALKKVQQGLNTKTGKITAITSTENKEVTGYIYADNTPTAKPSAADQQLSVNNKTISLIVLSCAVIISLGSIFYLYQQFKGAVPRFKIPVSKSFIALMGKNGPSASRPPAQELKPLAQFTVNQPSTANIPNHPPSVTLNIHGIMSNGSRNVVLINDQVYQEGDKVEGAMIVRIDLDSIVVDVNGTLKTIYVKN